MERLSYGYGMERPPCSPGSIDEGGLAGYGRVAFILGPRGSGGRVERVFAQRLSPFQTGQGGARAAEAPTHDDDEGTLCR
jgi:hypothetical protein